MSHDFDIHLEIIEETYDFNQEQIYFTFRLLNKFFKVKLD